jgi:hypothetical protein
MDPSQAPGVALKRYRLSQSIVAGSIAIGDIVAVYAAGMVPFLLYVYARKPSMIGPIKQ